MFTSSPFLPTSGEQTRKVANSDKGRLPEFLLSRRGYGVVVKHSWFVVPKGN